MNPESLQPEPYIDITDQIINDPHVCPIPITATHKVFYRYIVRAYSLVCRLCGEKYVAYNNYAMNNPEDVSIISKAVMNSYNVIYYHRLRHSIGPCNVTPLDKSRMYWNNGIKMFTLNSENSRGIDVTNVFENHPQLLMIIRSESIDKSHQYHSHLNDKYTELTVFPGGLLAYDKLSTQKEFDDEYMKQITEWDFECVYCGEEYESGLPSIEIICAHLITSCLISSHSLTS